MTNYTEERIRLKMGKTSKQKSFYVVKTKTVMYLYLYAHIVIVLMCIFGNMLLHTISNINTDKVSDINSIIEITNKKELKEITSQQGTFNVFITGKVTTFSNIKNDELGKDLLYLKETTYDNESEEQVGEEKVEKADFFKIYDMSINANKIMLLEPSITSTKIESGKRIEYSAISKGTEVIIQGTIENGILKDGAKLYTTSTLNDIKEHMDTTSNPGLFLVLWIILGMLLVFTPLIYVTTKKSFKYNEKRVKKATGEAVNSDDARDIMRQATQHVRNKDYFRLNELDSTEAQLSIMDSCKRLDNITDKLSETRDILKGIPDETIKEALSDGLDTIPANNKPPRQPKVKGGNRNYNSNKKPNNRNYNRKQPTKQQRKDNRNEHKESN